MQVSYKYCTHLLSVCSRNRIIFGLFLSLYALTFKVRSDKLRRKSVKMELLVTSMRTHYSHICHNLQASPVYIVLLILSPTAVKSVQEK